MGVPPPGPFGRLMNENRMGKGSSGARHSPAAVPRQRDVPPPRAVPAPSDPRAPPPSRGRSPRSGPPHGPTLTNVPGTAPAGTPAPSAVRHRNGRRPDAAPTPPTLATQLNNGDIAGRAAAPRPSLPLTPAAGP